MLKYGITMLPKTFEYKLVRIDEEKPEIISPILLEKSGT